MNPKTKSSFNIPRTQDKEEEVNSNWIVNELVDLNSLITYEQLSQITLGSVPDNTNLVRIRNNDGEEEIVQIKFVTEFPPGYHFSPTDEELIIHYLKEKINGRNIPYRNIPEVHLYKSNPQELTEKYPPHGEENEWLFFSPRDRKYPNGSRPKRAAGNGYWKVIGAEEAVKNKEETAVIGSKNELNFYQGKHPRGTKTDWVMNEYILDGAKHQRKDKKDMTLDDCVLCQIYKNADKNAVDKPARKARGADKKAVDKPARKARGGAPDIQEPAVETSSVADNTNNLGDIDFEVNETAGGGHYPQASSNGPHMVDSLFQNMRFRSSFLGQTSFNTMVPDPVLPPPMYDQTVFEQESSRNPFAQPTYNGFLSLDHNVGQSSIKPFGFQQDSPHDFAQCSDRLNMFSRLAETNRAEGYNVEYERDVVPGSRGLNLTETRGGSLPTLKHSSQYYMSQNPIRETLHKYPEESKKCEYKRKRC